VTFFFGVGQPFIAQFFPWYLTTFANQQRPHMREPLIFCNCVAVIPNRVKLFSVILQIFSSDRILLLHRKHLLVMSET
jgi:hypothetical protein